MNKIFQSREQIVENYKFYSELLPKGYLKVHFKPLSYYGYNTSLSQIPNYIFKYNNPLLKRNQRSVIIKDDDKKPNTIFKNTHKRRFKSLNDNSENKSQQVTNNFRTENLFEKEATRRIFDNTMLNTSNNLYSKDFKTNGVKVYNTKNNLYLPSITERMKNLKPRYDREERNFQKGYETAFN